MNGRVLETANNKASEAMDDEASAAPPIIKIAKIVSLVSLTLVAIFSIAHLAWKNSGSNQWELEIDKDGVKVYSLKAPDSALKRFKGVTRVKTTLNRAVAAMLDPDLENCMDWLRGCVSLQQVEPWNLQGQYLINFYRTNSQPPFSPRESVLKVQVTQDAKSKAVLVEFTAIPDMLPKNDCCYRILYMRNSWRYTPLENGEIEVEHLQDVDRGIPYIRANMKAPGGIYFILTRLPKLLNKEKYHHASFDFIKS
jgi:hypothetical protein